MTPVPTAKGSTALWPNERKQQRTDDKTDGLHRRIQTSDKSSSSHWNECVDPKLTCHKRQR